MSCPAPDGQVLREGTRACPRSPAAMWRPRQFRKHKQSNTGSFQGCILKREEVHTRVGTGCPQGRCSNRSEVRAVAEVCQDELGYIRSTEFHMFGSALRGTHSPVRGGGASPPKCWRVAQARGEHPGCNPLRGKGACVSIPILM